MRTDNTQWWWPCEESSHLGEKTTISQRMEKTQISPHWAHDRERRLGEDVWRGDTGGLRRPPDLRVASSRVRLPGGKERTRADENLEEPQGTREQGCEVELHGTAMLAAPWALGEAALSRVGAREPACPGCADGGDDMPQAEACEGWGGGRRPPPHAKGGRRGVRRKGPRPGGTAKAHTPSRRRRRARAIQWADSRGQSSGGTHTRAQNPIRPVPLPARPPAGRKSHSPAPVSPERRSALPCSAPPPPAQAPGGGAGRSRARPLPPHDSRETPPSRSNHPTSRPATTPPLHHPHPPLTQSQGSPPPTIQSQVPLSPRLTSPSVLANGSAPRLSASSVCFCVQGAVVKVWLVVGTGSILPSKWVSLGQYVG